MRILIANVLFAPTPFGGATIVAEQTARHLKQDGHEVLIYAGTEVGGLPEGQLIRYHTGDLDVVAVRIPRRPDRTVEFRNPASAALFGQLLDAYRPDVVHFHAVQLLGVDCVEQCRQRRIPVAVTLHDAWWLCERQFMITAAGRPCTASPITPARCARCVPDQQWNQLRQHDAHEILQHVDAILTPSEYWRTTMIVNGLPADKLHTNRNGITLPAPNWSRPTYDGPIRFGFVGGIGALKGSDIIVEAFRGMGRADYRFVAVDNTTLRGWRSMSPRDWPLDGEVVIVPGYRQEELDSFFGSIDVLLWPAVGNETFSLTVREATCRGVWVIASESGAVSDALIPGRNATLIPRTTEPSHLRDAMAMILDDPQRYRGTAVTGDTVIGYAQQAAELAHIYSSISLESRSAMANGRS